MEVETASQYLAVKERRLETHIYPVFIVGLEPLQCVNAKGMVPVKREAGGVHGDCHYGAEGTTLLRALARTQKSFQKAKIFHYKISFRLGPQDSNKTQ